ncbi:unnamed protein product [Ambrosiozyma monospora]|uniref:Unnamed protein product n=1 Tax=Ambrosiozyma monospora TaxID=43982 RepID=A0A9W6Z250_AMBMO|nr:unnamed protein product [Ambrosiozyma monospora]
MNLHILELIGQLYKDHNWDDSIRLIFASSDIHVIEKIDLKLVCQLTSIFGEVSIDSHSPAFEMFVSFLECYQIHPNLIKFHVNTGISRRRSTFPFYHLNYSKALRSLVGLAKQADFVELDHEDIDDIHKYGLSSKFTCIGFSLDYYSRNWLSEYGFLKLSKFVNLDELCLKIQDQMDLVCAMELMKNVSQFPDFINGQIPKKFRLVKVEPSPQGNRTSVPLDVFADAVREVISICKIPIEIYLSKTFFSYRDPHDSVGRLSGYLKNNVTGLSVTINSAKRPSNDVPIDYLLWLRHMNHLESLSVTAYGPTMVPSAALSKVSHTLKKLSLYHYVQIDSHLPQTRLVDFPNLESVHLEDCYLCSEFINLIPDRVIDLHVIYGSDEPTDTQVTHFKLPLAIKSFEWRNIIHQF